MITLNSKLDPGLYIVSTPIGNLSDISSRMINALSNSDYILCEDTRITLKLLNYLKIKKKLVSLHLFNENKKINDIVSDLKKNNIISLVSDAGTPALSDPGRLIISKCHEKNIKVIPIPGPSAITCAISASGFSDNFYFCGFLPKKQKEIEKFLSKVKTVNGSLVFFFPARDLKKNSEFFRNYFFKSRFFIAREMTKIHETYILDEMENIKKYIKDNEKGEMTFIVENCTENNNKSINLNLDKEISLLIGKMSSKDISEYLSKKLEINKKTIYQKLIKSNE